MTRRTLHSSDVLSSSTSVDNIWTAAVLVRFSKFYNQRFVFLCLLPSICFVLWCTYWSLIAISRSRFGSVPPFWLTRSINHDSWNKLWWNNFHVHFIDRFYVRAFTTGNIFQKVVLVKKFRYSIKSCCTVPRSAKLVSRATTTLSNTIFKSPEDIGFCSTNFQTHDPYCRTLPHSPRIFQA